VKPGILGFIVFGLIVGLLARLLVPGELNIIGSLVAIAASVVLVIGERTGVLRRRIAR